MANSEQILSDVLDWCINKTNISETKGIDHQGHRVDFIHYAAERGYYQVVRKLFESGISINCPAPNFLRKTPLHYASENNHLNVARFLLNHGAKVNCQNNNKKTPLHYAARNGHLKIVELLVGNGASINCENVEKHTPLHYACRDGNFEVAKFLLEKGANPNCQSDKNKKWNLFGANAQWTPLHYASDKGHLELAKLLIQKGANINSQNSSHQTPQELASAKGHYAIAKLISTKNMELLSLNQSKPSITPGQPANPDDCKICLDAKNGHFAFMPCGHAVACEKCCKTIVRSSDPTCPICRIQIKKIKKIFI